MHNTPAKCIKTVNAAKKFRPTLAWCLLAPLADMAGTVLRIARHVINVNNQC
jgi:hypothetical protein